MIVPEIVGKNDRLESVTNLEADMLHSWYDQAIGYRPIEVSQEHMGVVRIVNRLQRQPVGELNVRAEREVEPLRLGFELGTDKNHNRGIRNGLEHG